MKFELPKHIGTCGQVAFCQLEKKVFLDHPNAHLSSVHNGTQTQFCQVLHIDSEKNLIYCVILWKQALDNICPSLLNYFVQQNVPNSKFKSESHRYKSLHNTNNTNNCHQKVLSLGLSSPAILLHGLLTAPTPEDEHQVSHFHFHFLQTIHFHSIHGLLKAPHPRR